MDVRLVSDEEGRIFGGTTDWTVGAYYKDYSENLKRKHEKKGSPTELLNSQYQTKNKAI